MEVILSKVPHMEEKMAESHLTSASAFVEWGVQDACDDACSICLEGFCESDPSTVTNCKHEFHLQCILEWCQRNPQCPMCWQPIRLKDPNSQELFEVVEKERNFRVTPPRTTAIFHHPAIGEFELPHLPVGANDAEIEERIIQHLAATAAMGRARHIRRESQMTRSSSHGRPHFLVFSNQSSPPRSGPVSAAGGETETVAIPVGSPSTPLTSVGDEPSQQIPHLPSYQTQNSSGSTVIAANHQGSFLNNRFPSLSSSQNQDSAGPSEFQSFSESLKSRLNAASTRYKESISKSTRGWKERFFSRNSSMSDLGSEVRREVNAGIATVSRLMERLETRENNRSGGASVSNRLADISIAEARNQNNSAEARRENPLNDNSTPASYAAGSPAS
ncbi:E3 ubiquitin-protein ligase RHF2A-like [Quillaja saponaria]|uniref:RING-type E3 ubiquitin transferase n=1 Tax=Quillaja saponaria TaxID=32244 RepID=A0AAD7PY68_QUISA|nr:E3 ubiquitin-protein ligase RHF2A-like [Quillaja saponaria]KAJ7971354.1 E3 ubiquitin-protein ligase RHF2A-like [Quillaja saponaria]